MSSSKVGQGEVVSLPRGGWIPVISSETCFVKMASEIWFRPSFWSPNSCFISARNVSSLQNLPLFIKLLGRGKLPKCHLAKLVKFIKKKQRVPNGYFVEAHTWRQEAGGDSAQARSKRRRHLVAQGCALDTEQRAGAQCAVSHSRIISSCHSDSCWETEGENAKELHDYTVVQRLWDRGQVLLEVVIYPGSGLLTGVQIFLGLCEISRFLGLGQIGLSRKIRKSLKVLKNKHLVSQQYLNTLVNTTF